tara:strand:- start:2193 stop:2705 length:513 start_codon:yes stop_codon:yes gene_type:complete
MKLGNKSIILTIFLIFFFNTISISEDKILSTPLINLNKLKPSFEDPNEVINESNNKELIKNKKKTFKNNTKKISAKFFGLDKITAKSSEIIVSLGETKKFGPLEIKVLKCGKVELEDKIDNVAYLQVKDITESQNEKVFIFNGWTFASDPNITPFDHAIYDLQLISCENV